MNSDPSPKCKMSEMISEMAAQFISVGKTAAHLRNFSANCSGRMPCWVRTVPLESGTVPQVSLSMSNRSRATAVPTMSTIESTAPTSWKWTFIGWMPWMSSSNPS